MTENGADQSREIAAAVTEARAAGRPLRLVAGNSKGDILGRHCDADPLDLSGHRGIVDYEPGELVLSARAATPLQDICEALAREGQVLACESPVLAGRATLGGTLACNLSGPSRPWAGSIRDLVLGVELVNGRGELLEFGGRVMKNVAGYDVSRLQAGALGTLGVLTRITIKTQPRPEHSQTLAYDMTAREAIDTMNRRAGQPKPLNGACWFGGRLFLRLSGAASAVAQTIREWGGELLPEEQSPWKGLAEHTLPFFSGDDPLWRLSVRSSAPLDERLGETLIDWCGAQRWVRARRPSDDGPPTELRAAAETGGGHLCLYRGGDRSGEVRQSPGPVQQRLQQRLKKSFDPDGVLNPGRLYSWM